VPAPKAEPAKPVDAVIPEAHAPTHCGARISSEVATIVPLPPVSGAGECAIPDPVRLEAVRSRTGKKIAVHGNITVSCAMAEAIVAFVRDDLAAEINKDDKLEALNIGTSFECRGRNRVVGARISHHAFGNAIDVTSIVRGGKPLEWTDAAADKPMREAIRAAACSRFTTVLGPGSDGSHENHVHLDIAVRRSGYRICQWEVR
jgi:hypothetical protein